MKKAVALYVRVSSNKQDTAAQLPDLKRWLKSHAGRREIFWYRDSFTGTTFKRPGMQKLEGDIRQGKVGTLVVWRFDRLGRTVREMLAFLDDLDAAGVEFISIRDGGLMGNDTPAGRMFRHMLVGFSQFEREILSERIRAGIERARASGSSWGGRKAGDRYRLTPEKLAAVGKLLTGGTKKTAIARQLGIGRASVYRAASLLKKKKILTSASYGKATRHRIYSH